VSSAGLRSQSRNGAPSSGTAARRSSAARAVGALRRAGPEWEPRLRPGPLERHAEVTFYLYFCDFLLFESLRVLLSLLVSSKKSQRGSGCVEAPGGVLEGSVRSGLVLPLSAAPVPVCPALRARLFVWALPGGCGSLHEKPQSAADGSAWIGCSEWCRSVLGAQSPATLR